MQIRKIPLVSWLMSAVLGCASVASGAVAVVTGVAPAASSWPGSPIAASVSNPSGETSVAEGFSTTATSLGESFTVPVASSYLLDRICLYAGGGAGTAGGATLTLHLYDLGGQAAPNPGGYAGTKSLLGGGAGVTVSYAPQANGVLQLDFSGSDRVLLVAGRMYVFELAGGGTGSAIGWLRGTTDTYQGGAAYRNRAWINGSNERDFALAVYGTATATPPTSSTIDAGVVHQVIDGFGAGTAFLDAGIDALTDAQMDALYGTGADQVGLTLIRVRISPAGIADWTLPFANGKKAHDRGARILATPWTPPAAMKDNGSTVHGSLLPAQYQNYVDHLNAFIDAMAAHGAPVSVVSLQNEPDYNPDYEGCLWSAEQFRTFCRDFAGQLKAPVMMPESYGFNLAVSDAALGDAAAAANIDYIGEHLYGATIKDYPLARALGKPIWMTEYLENDQTIESAVATAQQIHDCLTTGNMSAYVWWKTIGNANGLLNAAGVRQRRAYVMAQFSRFVRPGDVRLDVPANDSSLGVSAYRSAARGTVAIVAVNVTGAAIPHTFHLQNLAMTTITPWQTTGTDSLAVQPAVAVTEGRFAFTVPAKSVVTFVGEADAAPQIVSGPESHAIASGATVVLEATAAGEPLRYQWLRDGVEVAGATARQLTIEGAGASDAGAYAVRVTNAAGTATSEAATLTVVATSNPGRLVNLSMRSFLGTDDAVPIGGFVIGGGAARRVLVRGAGPAMGIAGVVPDPALELHTGASVQTNDNWDASLAPTFATLGAFAWTPGSPDAALLATLPPGPHTAVLNGQGRTGIALVELYDADAASPGSALVNLSGRSLVGSGDAVQIAGFVIGGETSLTVVVRAAGPAMAKSAGVKGTLADPLIELHRQSDGVTIATADDWDASLAATFARVGAFAWEAGSKDAALMKTLKPGAYTVVVKGKDDTTGLALVEVYAVP